MCKRPSSAQAEFFLGAEGYCWGQGSMGWPAEAGAIDLREGVLESLTSFKRAGGFFFLCL